MAIGHQFGVLVDRGDASRDGFVVLLRTRQQEGVDGTRRASEGGAASGRTGKGPIIRWSMEIPVP